MFFSKYSSISQRTCYYEAICVAKVELNDKPTVRGGAPVMRLRVPVGGCVCFEAQSLWHHDFKLSCWLFNPRVYLPWYIQDKHAQAHSTHLLSLMFAQSFDRLIMRLV